MTKRLLSLALIAIMVAMFIPASAEWTMYVYTDNGKSLNVRRDPMTGDNVIGSLKYGEAVYIRLDRGNEILGCILEACKAEGILSDMKERRPVQIRQEGAMTLANAAIRYEINFGRVAMR